MLKKSVNPVVGSHGLPKYYQRSDQVYKKGEPVYDIDHDYVRYRYYDLLPAFNRNAYRINNQWDLRNVGEKEDPADDKKLFHRQGKHGSWKTRGYQEMNIPTIRLMSILRQDGQTC